MRLQCGKCNAVNNIGPEQTAPTVICGNCGQLLQVPDKSIAQWVVFHDFVVRKILRRGSDGVEVHAHQISLDRPAVLKILHEELSDNSEYVSLFVKRARAAAKLNHPGIVPIYLVSQEYGLYFIAREDTELQNLRDILARDKRIDVGSCLPLFQHVAEALDYAWRHARLMHGNLKPAYICVSEYGVAKLADLGVAHIDLGDEPDKIKGTPQYISPEQILGDPTDSRSDIYSLGANLYQCLTGVHPFVGDSTIEVFQQHLQSPLRPPNDLDPTIPESVCLVIAKMMAKSPDDRYPDCSLLAEDLAAAIRGSAPPYAAEHLPSGVVSSSASMWSGETEEEEEEEDDLPTASLAEDDEEEEDEEEILEAEEIDEDEDDEEDEEDDTDLTIVADKKSLIMKKPAKGGLKGASKKTFIKPGKKFKTKPRLPNSDD